MANLAILAAISLMRWLPVEREPRRGKRGSELAALKRIRIGFRTSITTLFVAIVLTVGLSLVYLSFERVNAIIRTAANTFIDKVAEHAGSRIETQFRDVLDDVEILRELPNVTAARLDNPAVHFLMSAMLRRHSQLFNLYVGYDDGSFLEIDFIDRAGAAFRERLDAPAGAVFRRLIVRPPVNGIPRTATTTYLSDDLVAISETVAPADYDPRGRPWYVGAYEPDASVLTAPYVFFASGQPGYTLRLPIRKGQRGVVAGDILLKEADAILKQQRLGQSGFAFLFDVDGRIIVHPRMSELIGQRAGSDGSPIALPQLTNVYKDGLPAAAQAWRSGASSKQYFDGEDGRTYLASFRSIGTVGSAGLMLVALAPLDEFFATVLKNRRYLFLLTLGCVLAALPAVILLGSMLSRSIRAIAAETDRIQRFEPGGSTRPHSIIREIDDLSRSVSTMRKVVETFSNFVPKRLVQQMVETGVPMRLGGERREITVMFTDVTDFTALTERSGPEQVMSQTSTYFGELSRTIMAANGTVDKFIGDAVMAMWNAPVLDPDHVINGCDAILACQAATSRLNQDFESKGWPAYHTRFGLHVGQAVVGNIGSTARMNYTALGATVNLAARLEGLNKVYGTSVLVSEEIKRRADSVFLFRNVDRISPKGFAEQFPIFELLGKRSALDERTTAIVAEWERIYAMLDKREPKISLTSLDDFLVRNPEDGVARHHADRLRVMTADPIAA